MSEATCSSFQKGLVVAQSGWKGWLTPQDIPHHTTQGGRGEEGFAVIPLLLKHIEEKQHAGLWQEEEKISMTAWSNLPLTIWKLVPLSFREGFFFSSFPPISLSTSIYCCSNSCPAITAQPAPLISLVCSISPILSPPLCQSLLFFHFLSFGLIIYVHPPHMHPVQLQDPQILLSGNCDAPPSLPISSYVLPGVPWL